MATGSWVGGALDASNGAATCILGGVPARTIDDELGGCAAGGLGGAGKGLADGTFE